jgi:hypothetical protein
MQFALQYCRVVDTDLSVLDPDGNATDFGRKSAEHVTV